MNILTNFENLWKERWNEKLNSLWSGVYNSGNELLVTDLWPLLIHKFTPKDIHVHNKNFVWAENVEETKAQAEKTE